MNPIRMFSTIICLFVASASFAQARIDRLVGELEKDRNVQVTYTEKRNPKTKKIEKQNTVLNGKSKIDADKLWNAFEQERENSVSVTKSGTKSFIIKFENKDYSSSYILTVTGGIWSLVVSKKSPSEQDNGHYMSTVTTNIIKIDGQELNMDDYCFNDISGLRTNGDFTIDSDGKGNVTIRDSNGNVRLLYESSTSQSKSGKSKSSSISTSRFKALGKKK